MTTPLNKASLKIQPENPLNLSGHRDFVLKVKENDEATGKTFSHKVKLHNVKTYNVFIGWILSFRLFDQAFKDQNSGIYVSKNDFFKALVFKEKDWLKNKETVESKITELSTQYKNDPILSANKIKAIWPYPIDTDIAEQKKAQQSMKQELQDPIKQKKEQATKTFLAHKENEDSLLAAFNASPKDLEKINQLFRNDHAARYFTNILTRISIANTVELNDILNILKNKENAPKLIYSVLSYYDSNTVYTVKINREQNYSIKNRMKEDEKLEFLNFIKNYINNDQELLKSLFLNVSPSLINSLTPSTLNSLIDKLEKSSIVDLLTNHMDSLTEQNSRIKTRLIEQLANRLYDLDSSLFTLELKQNLSRSLGYPSNEKEPYFMYLKQEVKDILKE